MKGSWAFTTSAFYYNIVRYGWQKTVRQGAATTNWGKDMDEHR